MSNTIKKWTSTEKREILEYAGNHTIREASEKYGISATSIKHWKNPEKYQNMLKCKRECPEHRAKNAKRAMREYHENKDLFTARSKKSRRKRRFKRLVEMSNRFFPRNEWLVAWDLWKIARKQGLICTLTGKKLTNANISVDHIIPKSKGGNNRPENIRLVDKDANLARRALTDEEFFLLCESVVNTQKSRTV